MASYWITAVASITGAVVGAGATLIANWISARSQSRTQMILAAEQARTQMMSAADEREKQDAEVRRVACAEYLIAADSFYDQARELVYRMENGAEPSELKEAHDDYSAGWKLLKRAVAPVVIAGPRDLGEQADALMAKLAELGKVCDDWYTARVRDPSVRGRGTKFWNARAAAEGARAEFVSAAQKRTRPDGDRPAISAR